MNEQLQNAFAALADKLGTSVDHLWPVLIKQQIIAGIYGFCITAFWLVICYVVYRLHKSFLVEKTYATRCGGEDTSNTYNRGDNGAWVPHIMIFLALVSLIGAVVCIITTGQDVACIINPEYYALKDLLGQVTGK